MVGLSSEKDEASKEIVDYLANKDIKMCVFADNIAELQSLRPLLESRDKDRE